jgi:hypothetical protein
MWSATQNFFVDLLPYGIGHRAPDLFSEGGEGEDAHPDAGPDFDLRVAMLPKDVRVHGAWRDSDVLPDERAQTRAVQNRTRLENAAGRQPGDPRREMGHEVHWIGSSHH